MRRRTAAHPIPQRDRDRVFPGQKAGAIRSAGGDERRAAVHRAHAAGRTAPNRLRLKLGDPGQRAPAAIAEAEVQVVDGRIPAKSPMSLQHPARSSGTPMIDVSDHAEGWVPRAHVRRAVIVVVQPIPAAMREEADPQQHRRLVIRAEESDGQEDAGQGPVPRWRPTPVSDAEPEYTHRCRRVERRGRCTQPRREQAREGERRETQCEPDDHTARVQAERCWRRCCRSGHRAAGL